MKKSAKEKKTANAGRIGLVFTLRVSEQLDWTWHQGHGDAGSGVVWSSPR